MNKYLSTKLRWLSFIATWGVVFFHSRTDGWGGGSDLVNSIHVTLYQYFKFAVPCFFFISGFFFTYSWKTHSHFAFYKTKFLNLYLPTLVWSYLSLLLILPVRVVSGQIPTLYDWVTAPFLTISCPETGRFWYVRDLLIMFFAAPLFYWAARIKWGLMLLVVVVLIMQRRYIWWHPGVISVFFFSLGCLASQYEGLLSRRIPRRAISSILAVIIAIVTFSLPLWLPSCQISGLIYPLCVLVTFWVFYDFFGVESFPSSFNFCFFTYCVHQIILFWLGGLRLVVGTSPMARMCGYLILGFSFWAMIFFGGALKKFAPRLMSFLSGGRSK